jgi:putative tryptophan/tyrosine transport system substrate-binding protein
LGTPAIVAARKVTAVIPIVFPIASDPVGDGLVASLARQCGHIAAPAHRFAWCTFLF